MPYVTANDFIDKFELTKSDSNESMIEGYISRYETISLVELFGKELFDLWEAGVIAIDPIYTKLQLPFTEQLECGTILNSRGIGDYILGVVYYYYTVDNNSRQTINGPVRNKGENSDKVRLAEANIHGRYNEGIETYRAIQDYICENKDVYPTFKGLHKDILSII